MTISPLPREKINVPNHEMGSGSSKKAWFVVVDKGNGIVKCLNIVPSVPLRAVSFSVKPNTQWLYLFFFDSTLVEEFFYFKAFQLISIAFHKHGR